MTNRGGKRAAASQDSKNIVRGLASQIRSQQYNVEPSAQAANFRMRRKRAMLQARAELAPHEYSGWFDRFERQNLKAINYVRKVPVGDSEIVGIFIAPPLKLPDEVRWVGARLARVVDELNGFLLLMGLYNAAVWGGDFDDARATLALIESNYGLSVWSICNQIPLEQMDGGIEAQKAFASEIGRRFRRGLVAYLAHYVSIRNEPSVSWSWYADDIGRRVSRSRYGTDIKSYLRYHFTGVWPNDRRSIAQVLQIEQSHSDIDLYETFVSFVENALCSPPDREVLTALEEALRLLSTVRDPRLAKARAILGLQEASLPFLASESATRLLKGRVGDALRSACRVLQRNPTAVHEALVAAFAGSASPRGFTNRGSPALDRLGPCWSAVLPNLAIVFRRTEDFADAADRLTKLAINLRNTPAGRALQAAVAAEVGSDPTTESRQLRAVALNIEWRTFCDARAGLDEDKTDAASRYFGKRFVNHPDGAAHGAAAAFGAAVKAADDQCWDEVADHAAEASLAAHAGLSARARLLLMAARTRLGLVDQVIEDIEREVANPAGIASYLLPHTELVDSRPWSDFKPSVHRLGLPITLDLALKATGADRTATFRRFAYDAFLHAHSVTLASELAIDQYPQRLLAYFLEHVAVPSVLDMSEALDSSMAIQTERRAILSLLIALDPDQAAQYQDEIVEITEQLEVAEGLKLVDSSRIHVDVDAIEAWARRELAESYARYRILLESGIGVSDDFNSVLAGLRKLDEKSKNLFAIPDNEADELLVTIIRKLLDRFLYDPAHGLDSYLSRRIRHGSIVGFLRGPVEEGHLVTLRREADDSYAPNTYWLNNMADLDAHEQQIISAALDEFARTFDDALIALRDTLIQIRDKDHPRGIFAMQLYAEQYHLIRSIIKDEESFATFTGACFASFWALLDRYLRIARAYIQDDLRLALASAFENLRAAVNQLYPAQPGELFAAPPRGREGVAEFHASITAAQSNLQAALPDVATWFTRSEVALASRTYTAQEAVTIGVRSALARLRRFDPELDIEVSVSSGLLATDLSIIADIMLIAIGNACERSGMGNDTPITIRVGSDETRNLLVFDFRNPIDESARLPDKCKELEAIRKEISQGAVSDLVRKDRKSGLRKLGALKLNHVDAELDFGFDGDSAFYLRLALPLQLSSLASEG